ncbi:MAG: hypothetical protein EOL97_10085 [Spirochaetia bacterium]|nr:hypothetical protein [Spirochaetia bacterium]
MVKENKKGLYQIRRIKADLRSGDKNSEGEVLLNNVLNELQLDDNIEIVDVTEIPIDKSQAIFLIKYIDYGLLN